MSNTSSLSDVTYWLQDTNRRIFVRYFITNVSGYLLTIFFRLIFFHKVEGAFKSYEELYKFHILVLELFYGNLLKIYLHGHV